jgi:DNA-directed RNA polymerase specialized sigma24 family protein
MHLNHVWLVDEYGQPFSARLHDALTAIAPRLQQDFPMLKDLYVLTEVLEETARRIVAREERGGPLRELQTYAWVIATRTAALRLSQGGWAVVGATLPSEQSEPALANLPSAVATVEQMEAEILAHELDAQLSPEDRDLCLCKRARLSTEEIAIRHGISLVAVRTRWHRVKGKLHSLMTSGARRPGQVRG